MLNPLSLELCREALAGGGRLAEDDCRGVGSVWGCGGRGGKGGGARLDAGTTGAGTPGGPALKDESVPARVCNKNRVKIYNLKRENLNK